MSWQQVAADWDVRFTVVFAAAALRSFLGLTTYGGFTVVLLRGSGGLALQFPDQRLGFVCIGLHCWANTLVFWLLGFVWCLGCVPLTLYCFIQALWPFKCWASALGVCSLVGILPIKGLGLG